MSRRYSPEAVEQKWRERWEASGLYRFQPESDKPKHYAVTMLPYPSGNLHIGHWYAMAPSDAHARYMRMRGNNVLFPMGFDAFGLPAENAAIKRNLDPRAWTYSNIEFMRNQLKSIGMMIDWDQEIISADPEYYRWNQWFFIQFFKRGLAYKKFSAVDWCPSCNTTLAREQVIGDDRRCERCGTLVIKRDLDQWYFKITNYAEELLDFSHMEWPERITTMQRNWIGRSEGAEVTFRSEQDDPITVFTTRPDTLWGATFMVLAPEHPLVAKLTSDGQRAAVEAYVAEAVRKTEVERQSTDDSKQKTGVWIGAHAVNPVSGERIPIWIADYVLITYGTGAIMAVPGHDQRDFAFAKTFELPIKRVVAPDASQAAAPLDEAFTGDGVLVNSGIIDGMDTDAGWEKIVGWLEDQGIGKRTINYRLRDWLVSRQRYWGTPIPMVTCPQCGIVPLPEDQLPLKLPDQVDFKPTGESPLKLHPTWRFTTCPQCGGEAERDTDTMDTFVDSSWYHCRYLSPKDSFAPFDPDLAKHWLPVDQYSGGAEHAVMHLMYARFWWKAMRDLGLVEGPEPMLKLINQGVILGEDSQKMSKSRGNVIDPDMLAAQYGADVVRTFLMFIGPWEQGGPWNSKGIEGAVRFLDRAWRAVTDEPNQPGTGGDEAALRRVTQRTIKKVGDDIARFSFNTAVSALMEFVNELMKARETAIRGGEAWRESCATLALLLAPIAPHLAEEIWEYLGKGESVHLQAWPAFDEALLVESEIELPVQVNGKVRGKVIVPADAAEDAIIACALANERIAEWTSGKQIVKQIVVPGKLVNLVVK
ncbi:MAG TPA: leucine--tRNA ligase [Herpetosiphonaceae bacterium]